MVSNMNMSKLFSTKEREAVLAEILLKKGKISGAEVARNLGISKGFVSRYLAILKKEKIITRSNGDYVAEANLGVRLLRIILNLKPMAQFNFRKYPFVTGVGIYGSCIKGARRTFRGPQKEVGKCEPAVFDGRKAENT
jgi:DNA-binding Lrp family transcriptional regulator